MVAVASAPERATSQMRFIKGLLLLLTVLTERSVIGMLRRSISIVPLHVGTILLSEGVGGVMPRYLVYRYGCARTGCHLNRVFLLMSARSLYPRIMFFFRSMKDGGKANV